MLRVCLNLINCFSQSKTVEKDWEFQMRWKIHTSWNTRSLLFFLSTFHFYFHCACFQNMLAITIKMAGGVGVEYIFFSFYMLNDAFKGALRNTFLQQSHILYFDCNGSNKVSYWIKAFSYLYCMPVYLWLSTILSATIDMVNSSLCKPSR